MGASKHVEPSTLVVTLTQEQLHTLVMDAVSEALSVQKHQPEGYLDTEQAAAYLGTTVSSLRVAVARGNLTPDHRGQRGGGLKGNRFSRQTLDAFCKRVVK